MNDNFHYTKRFTHSAVLAAILSATCLGAQGASFDCAKARSQSERLICGDPRLSALDDRLAALARDGKQRAHSPRAYQRALDNAWLLRQKCQDIACVESWYARRIAVLSDAAGGSEPTAQSIPVAKPLPLPVPAVVTATAPPAERMEPVRPPVAPPVSRAPQLPVPVAQSPTPAPAVEPRAPVPTAPTAPIATAPHRPVSAPLVKAQTTPTVSPVSQLQVIGQELGFNVPATRDQFLDRYQPSGGHCGVSAHLASLKVLSPSATSDCWTGTECPVPATGLRCQILRTAYDSTGRIVLFTTKLSALDATGTEGARALENIVHSFSELGHSETRTRNVKKARVISSTGWQGQFKLDAEVKPAEGGGKSGIFTVATK